MNSKYIDWETIKKGYPNLTYDTKSNTLKGNISICRLLNDEVIKGNYDILIDFNNADVPCVYETGKAIPKTYEHKYLDNRLCLATDIEQKIFLEKNKSISLWLKTYVESYFISYEYYRKYRIYPFGSYSHGRQGIIEFYIHYFGIEEEKNCLGILEYILFKRYRGHDDCPCGSKEKVRNCHKDLIIKSKSDPYFDILKNNYTRSELDEKKRNF